LIYNKKRISVFLFRKKLILGGKKGKVVEIVSRGEFTIKTETPEPTPKTLEETNSSSPETGDHTQIYVVMICLMSSLMMFGVVLVSKRRSNF